MNKRRRTFCSDYCVHQWRLRTDPGYLRDQVFARDRGVCALCQADTIAIYNALRRARGPNRKAGLCLYGLATIHARRSLWDADHILPVAEGGGQCDLDNLRTLCLPCHREVTASLRLRRRTTHSTASRALPSITLLRKP
ncbi:HNH endonuclease [Granulicella sibirica]|uniref:HNH endonuclease n=1 Tax=Granulicella sibirica TaxID=2479048 RepID=UPI001F4FDFD5|nr:HNH endonuclease signature motif containing protein [Granulicella sibirica]